jgi:hypothetical protein
MFGVLSGISRLRGRYRMEFSAQHSYTAIALDFDAFVVAQLLLWLAHNTSGYLSDTSLQNSPVFKRCDITYVKMLPFEYIWTWPARTNHLSSYIPIFLGGVRITYLTKTTCSVFRWTFNNSDSSDDQVMQACGNTPPIKVKSQ